MKADIVFALDVGGTFIKACIIEQDSINQETISQFDAHSDGSQDTIMDHFVSIILSLAAKYKEIKTIDVLNKKTIGIGFAFPGPFDYQHGISYIKGLNKFESLYGVNLSKQLFQRIQETELASEFEDLLLSFENDARLFGLGASTLYPDERFICLTIGTGLGSVFIDRGKIVKNTDSVPPEGYLYHQPFKDARVDDYFSRRGILKAAAKGELLQANMDVKELAELAKGGNEQAQSLFTEFGADLGDMLLPFIEQYKPQRIVIGGQIAKSIGLFQSSLDEKLISTNTKVSSLEQALHYTFIGISRLFA